MIDYRRAVAYVDYMENGVKIRNGGNVRIEVNGDICRLYVYIRGIYTADMGIFPIWDGSGRLLGNIEIKDGAGSFEESYRMPEEWDVVRNDRIQILLHGDRQLKAVWSGKIADCPHAGCLRAAEQSEEPVESSKEEMQSFAEMVQTEAADKTADKTANDDAVPAAGRYPEEVKTETVRTETVIPETVIPETIKAETVGRTSETAIPYMADKWGQLYHLYPKIHPFEDGREYLSLAPKDMVVLRQEYQKMVHNSFLLHGYYNYQHLILGIFPGERRGEVRYYLGVPGNFYNREKMVAEMFGFEAFEGERHPAAPGDFGYYMKRVEL